MKLLRLKLNDAFRSLPKDFVVDFLRERDHEQYDVFNPYCLAGLNGSGKSNILEALAAIFYHIETIHLSNRPADFEPNAKTKKQGFGARFCEPNAFELEYLIPDDLTKKRTIQNHYKGQLLAHIRIVKKKGEAPKIFHSSSFPERSSGEELESIQVKAYLPTYILGYSSGHNQILSLPFFKMRFIHYDEYHKHLTTDQPYPGKPEGRMIYLDEQYSQAILLCHFLFPSPPILKVFEDKIKLQKIKQFRIIIRHAEKLSFAYERLETMNPKDRSNPQKNQVELTSLLSNPSDKDLSKLGIIDKFIKCSTTSYNDYSPYQHEENAEDYYDLYLDYWVNEATHQAFETHFGAGASGSEDHVKAASALNLFQAFQILLTLNLHEVDAESKTELYQSASLYVNETVPTPSSHRRIMRFKDGALVKKGVKEPLYIKSLSDGEYQLLHTIGLCLLFRHTNCLFLLDEPETHLNPDWRASYITTLRDALKTSDNNKKSVMREVLLTSHSPFVISDCNQGNVLVFEKDKKTGKVSYRRPDFNTFGASANKITSRIFKQKRTIGNHAMHELESLRKKLNDGESPEALIDLANETLGDSIEKVIFVNQALDKETEH